MSSTPKWVATTLLLLLRFEGNCNHTGMFPFAKVKKDSSSSASSTGKPPPLTRHDTFGSQELFEAWAKDSFINQSTIDILVKAHEIDCLPAVLALKKEDFPRLNLPVGQRRLLEGAVEKLRQDYELVQPPTPKSKISLEMPVYKSMLEIGELAEEDAGITTTEVDPGHREMASRAQLERVPHAKSQVKPRKDKQGFGPEKEALLESGESVSSPQMQEKEAQRKKG